MKIYYTRWVGMAVALCSPLLLAAQATITGRIADVNDEALIGVTVTVKGTTFGTTTDFDGGYELAVPEVPATIEVSYIGYAIQEVDVESDGAYDVVMVEDIANLDEVVVTGLASSIKRSNAANSVATVSGAALTEVTTQSTVDGALYGKLTGVNIVSTGGAPGGGIALRLRGISSLSGNNQPLFIVDGVYISNAEISSGLSNVSGANDGSEEGASNRLADLNPEDIASIEVLKGASAAAIYGTRANAGVVIINTKKGRAGETEITFNQDIGVNFIQKYAGRYQYDAQSAALIGQRDQYNAAAAAGRIEDLEKAIYGEKGLISDSRISIRGGNEKTIFYLNGSLRDEDGIIKNTGFERASIRLNLEHEIVDGLTLTSSTNYINSKAQRSFTGNENEGGLSYGYTVSFTPDWANLRPVDGVYPDNPYYSGNPFLVRDIARNDETNNRLIQGFGLNWRALTADNYSLRFVANGGLDLINSETDVYVPEFAQAQVGGDNGFITAGRNKVFQRNYTANGVFNYFLEDNVSFETTLGVSYLNFDTDLVRSTTRQLVPLQTSLTQGAAQEVTQGQSSVEEFGYVGQETVNFRDQIIATVGIRLDKSSLNGDPNKLYAFPRASLAVNLTEFDFFEQDLFSQVKLRAAYGQTGSSAGYGNLFTRLAPTNINGTLGFTVDGAQGNSTLAPERSSEIEAGIDLRFFEDRLGIEASYYRREVTDLLYDRSIPTSSGFSNEIRNDLDLVNRGVEIGLNISPINTENFTYNTNVNWWFNRSEVTRLGEPGGRLPDGGFAEGDIPSFTPPGVAFGLGLGTFFVDEGSPITAFFGTDTSSVGDVAIIGNSEPDFQLGWFNQLQFGENFVFNFLVHWKEGGDVLNLTRLLTDIGLNTPDLPPPGGEARENFDRASFVEDASYFRLREVGAYYTIPLESKVVKRIKVGASARNLFTLTDYSSYDPEVSAKGGSGLSTAVEVTPFPSSRQVYGHLSFTF